jgi:hypothetical protein
MCVFFTFNLFFSLSFSYFANNNYSFVMQTVEMATFTLKSELLLQLSLKDFLSFASTSSTILQILSPLVSFNLLLFLFYLTYYDIVARCTFKQPLSYVPFTMYQPLSITGVSTLTCCNLPNSVKLIQFSEGMSEYTTQFSLLFHMFFLNNK